MKKAALLFGLFVIITITFQSCNKNCENLAKRNLIFLVDVTDSINFKNIKTDITNNIKVLNEQKKVFNLDYCEGLNFKIGKLSESENISFSKIEREINVTNMNKRNFEILKSPDTIYNFINDKLTEYEKDSFVKSNQSNIANNILKTILDNKNQAATIFVFSDMVENNQYLLMYKNQFQNLTPEESITKLFDTELLSQLKSVNKSNLQLVIVQKQESKNLTKTRDVKQFWVKIFEKLEVKTVFIDDLTHNY